MTEGSGDFGDFENGELPAEILWARERIFKIRDGNLVVRSNHRNSTEPQGFGGSSEVVDLAGLLPTQSVKSATQKALILKHFESSYSELTTSALCA